MSEESLVAPLKTKVLNRQRCLQFPVTPDGQGPEGILSPPTSLSLGRSPRQAALSPAPVVGTPCGPEQLL